MHITDVGLLCCVDCSGDLALVKSEMKGDVILSGVLKCSSCGRAYPIIREVGVFFRKGEFAAYVTPLEKQMIRELGCEEILLTNPVIPDERVESQSRVAKNWDYQHASVYNWEEDIDTDRFHGKRLFWTFNPVDSAQIRDKVVYAACVGRGKEIYHILQEHPRKIIANELGASFYSLPSILKERQGEIMLLRYDISYPPLKDEVVDVAICDHALQHVYDHKRAYSLLCDALKPGGLISVCVYSYEHNFLMTHIIEPIKHFLRHIPLRIIRIVAFPPALFIYALIHLIYAPFSANPLIKKLPLYEHMIFWSTSTLKFIWSACFDLLHAPISFHFSRDEMVALAESNHLKIEKLINTHGTTWSLVAKKKTVAPHSA